jgi:uncharacterized protein (DUF486 family)
MELGTLGVYIMIYIGTIFYTIASYFHLKIKPWTFMVAYIIALSCVVMEYQFSLRGNHLAASVLNINPAQILIVTTCFCFVNVMILNFFVLKYPIKWWRELLSLLLIVGAIIVSNL